uniref:NIT domain-containing protein n=1 Tax=Macrostomum lignano TaxID=282301 RepID=A0A1I8IY35_9PLAT
CEAAGGRLLSTHDRLKTLIDRPNLSGRPHTKPATETTVKRRGRRASLPAGRLGARCATWTGEHRQHGAPARQAAPAPDFTRDLLTSGIFPRLNVNSRFCPTKFPNFPNIAPSVRQVKSRDSTRLATVFSQFWCCSSCPSHSSSRAAGWASTGCCTASIKQPVEEQINSTLSLVKIVSDCNSKKILDDFQDKCEQLGSRQGDQSCCGSALDAWFSLLKEMHEEAKSPPPAVALAALGALMKNVHSQLSDLGSHKSAQAGRIFALRSRLDQTVAAADRSCGQRLQEFNELYGSYASDSRNASRLVSSLLSAHNEYVLSLRSANRTKEELYGQHLPGMLAGEVAEFTAELEEIQLDATNALTGALESHCYLRMS